MTTYEKVLKYCEENKISIAALEKKAGIGNGTISAWGDESHPSIKSLEKLAECTKTAITDWL